MRLRAIVLGSILGMGSSSGAVAWWTADADAAQAGPREPATPTTLSQGSEPLTNEADARAGGLPVVGTPAIPATFETQGTVRLSGQVGHPSLPADRPHETFLMVEVDAPEDFTGQSRAPVNLAIVIDRSGSMKGQRLANAVAAARGMVERLRPDDTVSLIAYHSRAEQLIAPTRVHSLTAAGFESRLRSLRGRGHTCISCGINLARGQMRSSSDSVNRILLLSDGVANRGTTRAEDFRALGDIVREERTAIASVGVDVDYDERSLFALSQASNGRHYFVENPSGLAAVFDREAQDLVGTVADRVDVDVRLAEGVELLEVIARGHQRRGDSVSLSFGTLQTGEDRSALLRVRVDPSLGDREIASMHLAYRDLAQRTDRRSDGVVGVRFDSTTTTVAEPTVEVEERLARKDTLDALLKANEAFARGDAPAAKRALLSARGRANTRRKRASSGGARPAPKVDSSYQRQLDALEQAEVSFDDATISAPPTAAAPSTRKGKKAIRLNAEAADPFG